MKNFLKRLSTHRSRALKATLTVGMSIGMIAGSIVAGEKPMNVLFIAIDDLKPSLGCYDVDWIKSPNIDAIAKDGTTFLNNHCQWAVCGPSRASLMTGLRPESSKVMDLKTDMRKVRPDIVSLPEAFKDAGYETGARGKIYDPRCVPGGRSKDDPKSWSLPYQHVNSKIKNTKQAVNAPDAPAEDFPDGAITLQGLELLEQMSKQDKPFFLAVGFKKPHLPFEAPKSYWDLYQRESIPLDAFPGRAEGDHAKYAYHNGKELRGYGGVPKKGPIPEDLQKELIHGYAACVSFVDDMVGRIIKSLKDKGLYDNTIIVVWGDHGFHLGDHKMWGKHSNLEQSTRSPLIIRVPGMPNAQRSVSPTEFIDIFPTLVDLCGIDAPKQLQGKSLKPILKDPKASVKRGAISNFKKSGALGYAYRTERYRYVEWLNRKTHKAMAIELYDYQNDPGELVNLAKNPEHEALIKDLAQSLRQEGEGCHELYQ